MFDRQHYVGLRETGTMISHVTTKDQIDEKVLATLTSSGVGAGELWMLLTADAGKGVPIRARREAELGPHMCS
jgi:hypothetical protein